MKPKKTPTAAAAASRYFAYLRVSTDDQNAANQKLGLLEYANAHGFAPLKIVEETGSRAKSWRKRALADVLAEAQRGDVILSPEISRLGESALQVLDFMAEAVAKGVAVHITKQKIVLDGSLQAEIMATVLGLAAQLMAMVLLVAIGKEFINHYYTQISENMASQELAVMLVISVILLFLVNKVPPMISGLVSGGGIGAADRKSVV